MSLPLTGLRVVDFSRVLAGPHCAKTLLDLGADVIKVEPPTGDLSRRAFPRTGEISGYFAQQNAGKRNLSIDLNVPESREIALRLCDRADIIVENFRPGTLEAFGLGYTDVAARNPAVVYASISGYGRHGAWSSRMAYAPTVQAESGLTALTWRHRGQLDGGDSPSGDSLSHADVYSGLHAVIGILAAVRERLVTGKGQHIDVAMAAVMLSINERVHAELSNEDIGDEPAILGATDGPIFSGPGGETLASPMSLVGSMSFPFYLAAMRRADLADDPRFLTPALRKKNLFALHRIVQNWVWSFNDLEALEAQLDEAKIAIGRVRTTEEIAGSEWAEKWSAIRTVYDGRGNSYRVPGRPWHFNDEVAPSETLRASTRGEHNRQILRELGYSATEIDLLEATRALVRSESAEPGDR